MSEEKKVIIMNGHGPGCTRFVEAMLSDPANSESLGTALAAAFPNILEREDREEITKIVNATYSCAAHDAYHVLDEKMNVLRHTNQDLEDRVKAAIRELTAIIKITDDVDVVAQLKKTLQPLASEMHERSERRMAQFAQNVHDLTQVPVDILTSDISIDDIPEARLLKLSHKFSPILLRIYMTFDDDAPRMVDVKMEELFPKIAAAFMGGDAPEPSDAQRIAFAKWIVTNARDSLNSEDDRESLIETHQALSSGEVEDVLARFRT